MILQVKDFATDDVLFEYTLIRAAMNDNLVGCLISGGFQESIPEKGKVYKLYINDVDTSTTLNKIAVLTSYNFLLDKDGSNPATISDNSLIFQVMA